MKGVYSRGRNNRLKGKTAWDSRTTGDSMAAWHVWRTLDMWNSHECVFVHGQGENKYIQKLPPFL